MIYDTICHECATSLGWTPVTMTDSRTGEQIPRPVGMWEGKCDACGLVKGVCASRDYDKPGMRRLTGREALEALFIAQLRDSQSPPGEEEIEEASMERNLRYEILVRVSVPLVFDADDTTPEEKPDLLREIIAENAMEYISFLDPEEFAKDIREIKLVEDSGRPIEPAKYISFWDDAGEIETDCLYNPASKEVSDIQKSDVEAEGLCLYEWVRLADGTEIRDFWVKD